MSTGDIAFRYVSCRAVLDLRRGVSLRRPEQSRRVVGRRSGWVNTKSTSHITMSTYRAQATDPNRTEGQIILISCRRRTWFGEEPKWRGGVDEQIGGRCIWMLQSCKIKLNTLYCWRAFTSLSRRKYWISPLRKLTLIIYPEPSTLELQS
jgi:hypothetical protein